MYVLYVKTVREHLTHDRSETRVRVRVRVRVYFGAQYNIDDIIPLSDTSTEFSYEGKSRDTILNTYPTLQVTKDLLIQAR